MRLHHNDTTKLEKEMSAVYGNLRKTKETMLGKLKTVEDILYTCEDSRRKKNQSDPETKDKLNFKMGSGLREYKEALDKYKSYYAYTKNYEDQCKSSMKIMMKAYQKLAEDRIQNVKDSLQKLIIFETSMNQNNKYDIDQIGKVIFAIDIPQTVSSIAEAHTKDISANKLSMPPLELPDSPWRPLLELYEQDYCGKEILMDYELVVEETKTHIVKSKDSEYKKHEQALRVLFSSILGNAFNQSDIKTFIEALEEKKARLAFFNILKEFSEPSGGKVKSESYKALARIAFGFLDKSHQAAEVEQIYKLIEVASKISLCDSENAESLFYAVKTHEVWRDVKFWQTAVKNVIDTNIRMQRGILLTESQKNGGSNTLLEK
eukprot:TRINITY_DN16393_c0_g1_i3.p1 TRINITY_DN16393_c0_g1~~TRINITY_DN16393_c0_g1_i3.p1  ORF type:complete len:376 (-),score=97.65 TRINITY_DN16393_c0_g1_i3:420-1547(-)